MQTYVKKCETLYDYKKRVQPSLNNIIDSGRVLNGWEDSDKDFSLTQWIDQGSQIKEAYQAVIKVYPI